MLYTVVVTLIVIVSVLLTIVVLVQNSKGGGLASNFSGSNQIMGVRKTTDVLEKMTWTLASILIVLSILSVAFVNNSTQTTEGTSPIINTVDTRTNTNSDVQLPAFPIENPTPAE